MNKKGFTLIELLAVLVVLSILALISIPITIRIINQSRENSYKRSIANYAKALEDYIALKNIDNSANDYDLLYNYANDEDFEKSYSGNRVICDYSSTSNTDDNYSTLINGKLILRGCRVGNVSNIYDYIDDKISKVHQYDVYDIGETIKVLNVEYQVIIDGGARKDYVVAIKKDCLTQNEVEKYGEDHINMYFKTTESNYRKAVGGYVSYYTSPTCGYMDENSSINTSDCKESYDDSDIKYIVDNWKDDTFKNDELLEIDSYDARLMNKDDLTALNIYKGAFDNYYPPESNKYLGFIWENSDQCQYWLMLPKSDGYYLAGSSGRHTSREYNLYAAGVRPVINVYKDKIDKE